MWLLYNNELQIYQKVQAFNERHKFTKINTVNIFAYGFYTFRRDPNEGGVKNYIACGPSIIMEELTQRPKTNQDFKRGLFQLLLLQQAGLSHNDIKLINMLMRNVEFVFIDFGLSECKSSSAIPEVESQDVKQYKEVWKGATSNPPSDEELTRLEKEVSDLLKRPDSSRKKRLLENLLKSSS